MKGRITVYPIYRERIFSGVLAILTGCFAIVFLGLFIYYQIWGPLGNGPPIWFFLGIGLFFLLITLNFAYLTVTVSSSGVTARFGIASHTVPLNDIARYYEDKASSISYGGFGIRFGWVHGKRRLVYSITNAPRIVIQRQRESNQEFVFSTHNPEGVVQAIKEALGTR